MKTEVAFQRPDPLGERRLGEVEVLGGMSEMAEVGDFHESPELPEFHSRLDYGPTRALGSTHELRRSATRPHICGKGPGRPPGPYRGYPMRISSPCRRTRSCTSRSGWPSFPGGGAVNLVGFY